jgi:MYXO-CTERM domain-containing protein
LVLVRATVDPLHLEDGQPVQDRRFVSVIDGLELGRESLVDEVEVPITGWEENPLTTPEPIVYGIELIDADPWVLEDDIVRVLDCNWNEDLVACDPIVYPTGGPNDPFPAELPPLDDAAAHADDTDPYASLQAMQMTSRFEEKLAAWGWDPYVWDEIDCRWQAAFPQDCRLLVHANVMTQDEEFGVFPYSGAFYSRSAGIFMGQGYNADTSYDGDIMVHEIGHHITAGVGSPVESGGWDDGKRKYVERQAINEGSSDFFARTIGLNDRIYDYFSGTEPGVYNDNRVRDVSIPFRCPENVVGETHMEGRMWATALVRSHKLVQEEYGDEDTFPTIFLSALPAIRHIPLAQRAQFPDASEILIDEVELTLGTEAAAAVSEFFEEAGLLECDHSLDLAEDPTLSGTFDAEDPLDARFMVFTSHVDTKPEEIIEAHPGSPAVQHTITLPDDQEGLVLRYRPGLWRPPHPVDDLEFDLRALIVPGLDGVTFERNEDHFVENDAELMFYSEVDPDGDGTTDRIVIDGLTPGESYSIALASYSTKLSSAYVIEEMQWEYVPFVEEEEPGETDTGSTEDESDGDTEGSDPPESDEGDPSETGSDDGGDGTASQDGDAGCGCGLDERNPAPAGLLLLGAIGLMRRRKPHARMLRTRTST